MLICSGNGGVAQLGERLNGIQEVIGSIPTVSTTADFGKRSPFFYSLLSKKPDKRAFIFIIDLKTQDIPLIRQLCK